MNRTAHRLYVKVACYSEVMLLAAQTKNMVLDGYLGAPATGDSGRELNKNIFGS